MKISKLILEAALFVSFIGFFAVMFINPGRWMGIFGSLFFILLPFNLILGKIMKQGKINIGKGGYFVLTFTMGIGLILLYISILAGDVNLVYDSKPLFMKEQPTCQQTKCEISFSINKNNTKDGQMAFLQVRIKTNNVFDAPQNLTATFIGPSVNIKDGLDNLVRPSNLKRVSQSGPWAGYRSSENYYSQNLDNFLLKPGEYKLIIQTTDSKNLLDAVQYIRGMIYEVKN